MENENGNKKDNELITKKFIILVVLIVLMIIATVAVTAYSVVK